ncbi:MAG: hypothetical protein QME32_08230, partial [Endomicrobiia bacterium]|nr:hypothetical protein [Endomicrobiia bacterium]
MNGWFSGTVSSTNIVASSVKTAGITVTSTFAMEGTATSTFAGPVSSTRIFANTADFGGIISANSTSTYYNSIIAADRTVTSTGNMNTNGRPLQVLARGSLVYVLDSGGAQITVYDVAAPRSPSSTEILTWATGGVAQFDIAGEFVFGANTTTGQIQRINLRYPNTAASVVATKADLLSVKVEGRYVYAMGSSAPSIEIYEINPIGSTLTKIGSTGLNSITKGFDIKGSNLYYSSGLSTTRVADISDPADPEEISLFASKSPDELVAQGNYLYATNELLGDQALKIYDISNSGAVYEVSSLDLNATTTNLFVSGDYAYTATSSGRIFVIDVKNPSSPTQYTLTTSGATEAFNDIYVEGHYLYAIDSTTNKFYIYDLGGLETVGLNSSVARIGTLDVTKEAAFQKWVDMQSGLSVAGGVSILGGLNV